jgi:hypothetical protein
MYHFFRKDNQPGSLLNSIVTLWKTLKWFYFHDLKKLNFLSKEPFSRYFRLIISKADWEKTAKLYFITSTPRHPSGCHIFYQTCLYTSQGNCSTVRPSSTVGKKEHTRKCYKHTQTATQPSLFIAIEKCFTFSVWNYYGLRSTRCLQFSGVVMMAFKKHL